MSPRTETAYKRIKRLTGRSWRVAMEYRISKLNEYVHGWMNYFGISEYYRPTYPGDRRLAATTRAHVLLETVAVCPHQSTGVAQTRYLTPRSDLCGDEPQRSLASVTHVGHPNGYDEPMA